LDSEGMEEGIRMKLITAIEIVILVPYYTVRGIIQTIINKFKKED
jgi:hypothetical protein